MGIYITAKFGGIRRNASVITGVNKCTFYQTHADVPNDRVKESIDNFIAFDDF